MPAFRRRRQRGSMYCVNIDRGPPRIDRCATMDRLHPRQLALRPHPRRQRAEAQQETGQRHHQCPAQHYCADKVVEIELQQARPAALSQRPKGDTARMGRIDHKARQQRHQHQQGDQCTDQFADRTEEPLRVQVQQETGQRFGLDLLFGQRGRGEVGEAQGGTVEVRVAQRHSVDEQQARMFLSIDPKEDDLLLGIGRQHGVH